jgi:lysophospholipase L1-like esterase
MNILVVGDSITRGNIGASYIAPLKKLFPHLRITNLATNGETIQLITHRLLAALKVNSNYDYIILQGGYNDIILPHFQQGNRLFRLAHRIQLKKGIIPLTDAQHFATHLKQTIQIVKAQSAAKIILVTMGCISESLSSPLNEQRSTYNNCIREIAHKESLLLADCGKLFDIRLQRSPQRSYFIESLFAVTIIDRLVSKLACGPRLLSKQRNLQLTIDGVHLNNQGAAIFSHVIGSLLIHEAATGTINHQLRFFRTPEAILH